MESNVSRLGRLYSPINDNPYAVKLADGSEVVISHRVPPRNEKRVAIKVKVRSTNGTDIGGQHVRGEAYVIVYKSQLPAIMADMMTDDHKRAWANAERVHQTSLNAYLDRVAKEGGWATEDKEKTAIARERAAERYGDTTPSAIFAQAYPYGCPPIESLEIVAEDIDAPTATQDEMNREDRIVTKLADKMADALTAAFLKATQVQAQSTKSAKAG